MKRYFAAAILLVGLGLVVTAMTINRIRSGYNLGEGRMLLLSGGLLVFAWGTWAPSRERAAGASIPGEISRLSGRNENRVLEWLQSNRLGAAAAVLVLLTLAMYAFFASTGTWTSWPETSQYYDDLGAALRAGRLDLSIQPPAALQALPDPYEPAARNRAPGLRAWVSKVWDLSYYKGKLYAYWGPVPGLLLAGLKLFYGGPIADQFLTFAFLAGLLVFSVLLLLRVQRRFYSDTPAWLMLLGLAVSALAYPIPWMLSHAAIYEASLSAGQFFLIGALYCAYRGLEDERPSAGWLTAASACWTLALCSRLLMAFPAAVLASVTFLWAVWSSHAAQGYWNIRRYAAALGLPLLAGCLALAGYNWARFGSALETGIRYTLTSENLRRFYSDTFRAAYAVVNLRLYLLSPIKVQGAFPFVWSTRVAALANPGALGIHHVEQMTGLLYAVPFAMFALAPAAELMRWAWGRMRKGESRAAAEKPSILLWLFISLIGSILISFAALLMYFYVAIRFLADVVPSLVLLSVLGMWQGYRYARGHRVGRYVYMLAVLVFSVGSIGVSLLLTMSESYPQFQAHNPHLMAQILLLFRH